MSVLTLGLWEIVGTPIEMMQGDKRYDIKVQNNGKCKPMNPKKAHSNPAVAGKTFMERVKKCL
jgi:hypothetical protein